MSNMCKGRVLFWNKGIGYGRIVPEGTEQKIYVHHSGLIGRKDLAKGQLVSFEIGENEQGLIAKNVEVLKNAKTESNT